MSEETEERTEETRDWLAIARDSFTSSCSYFDITVRPEVETSIRQFQGRFSRGSKYLTEQYRLKSKLFRPKTRSSIRKHEATAVNAFFSTEDVIAVRAVNDNNPLQQAAAKGYKYLLQHRLTSKEKDGIPWYETLVGAYQETMVCKIVGSCQEWEFDEVKGFDRPTVRLVPLENLRLHPAANWVTPVQSSPYIIEMIPMLVADVRRHINAGKWKPVADSQLLTARTGATDTLRQTREASGTDSKDETGPIRDHNTVWVHRNILADDDGDVVYYTLGTEALLTDPEPLEDVFHHGERPYVIGRCILEAHRLYAASLCDLLRPTQDEINDLANQRQENIKLILNKRWTVIRNKPVDMRSLQRNVAGSQTMVSSHDDVKMVETPDVTGSSYKEQDLLNGDFDELAGGFSQSSVASNRRLGETVGGMNILSAEGGIVGEYQLRTFVETWVEPVLRQLIKLERAYEDNEKILEQASEYAGEILTEEHLQQDVLLTCNVGIGNTNPHNQAERLIYGLTSLKAILGDSFATDIKKDEITKELFGKLGYRDGLRFFDFETKDDPAGKLALEKMQAEIDQIKGTTAAKQVEAMLKRMETLYSSIQTAMTAASTPATIPIADELAKSVGFEDMSPPPIYAEPAAPALPVDMPANTSPMLPGRLPGPGEGMMEGIETQEDDGGMNE